MDGKVTLLPRPDAPRPIIALVAHDLRKDEMVEWALYNRGTLSRCTIYATRTTGLTLQSSLDTPMHLLLSGPMGGDSQRLRGMKKHAIQLSRLVGFLGNCPWFILDDVFVDACNQLPNVFQAS